MRSQAEMMELILSTAGADPRIRAAYLNGSRTNPHAPQDLFQDYDLVYVTTDTRPFYEDEHWIDRFGRLLCVQMPEKMDGLRGLETHWADTYGWLMLFEDGNRIDLHVTSIPFAQRDILTDRLCVVLLDKDGLLPAMPAATDADHWVSLPSQADFLCDCNDFWWCLNNVAKGLWRREYPYVQAQLEQVHRPALLRMLAAWAMLENGAPCSVGKAGKYLHRFLPPPVWQAYLDTFSDCGDGNLWRAVDTLCGLFRQSARVVARRLGYVYNEAEDAAACRYLQQVRGLPRDAAAIFN